ncbi:MAG TPA: DUF6789 family protein [Bacteroidia bacterium]|nr:DUF6789 family protein [Bacteroidia bacterium]
MKTKISQALLGGVIGTAAMTMIMFMAPMMGIPKMNPAEMLSGMMGAPLIVGWMMHFMIGIIFAAAYVFILSSMLSKIKSKLAKGAIFGIIAFVFAQLVMSMMGKCILCMPSDIRMAMLMGTLLGHLVYGVVTAQFVKD